jgi:hypothetical protein
MKQKLRVIKPIGDLLERRKPRRRLPPPAADQPFAGEKVIQPLIRRISDTAHTPLNVHSATNILSLLQAAHAKLGTRR